MKLAFLACLGTGGARRASLERGPIRFEDQRAFDFPETQTEKDNKWSLANRCGGAAVAGEDGDQRSDTTCPNVLLINTDDMSWADVSLNNPSKIVPTPNIDRLVSKGNSLKIRKNFTGINFRDGHSCTSRCAPSRYCLMSGRYHFRRGNYHYKPMELEYGRKVLSHIFKRNNYYTMTIGKPQPVEDKVRENNDDRNYFFEEGTRFWAFDRSFSSRSYCCLPGGGYFENDVAVTPFDRWSIFMNFRMEDESSVQIASTDEDTFWENKDHWHLLDGLTVDGNPESKARPNSYMAYWNMIKNNESSGLNDGRRRRNVEGKRIMRHATNKIRRRKRNAHTEHYINEGFEDRTRSSRTKRSSYVRFQNAAGKVLVADHKLRSSAQERIHYEFAVNKKHFKEYDDAEAYRQQKVQECEANGSPKIFCHSLKISRPAKTQVDYDSRLVMKTFKTKAIEYIEEHVNKANPILEDGEERAEGKNRPFFMYLSFRAPHRPMSHDWDFDPENPHEHMPYVSFSKPGEQLGIFDEYIGDIMKKLQDLKVADNTFVIFTSDNGPDQGSLDYLFNRFGHLRMSTMRGKKASVYEGGHRVPFLTWWPKGIHKGLHGTNYDLPVSQTDLFATFADIMNYPLPDGDKCVYAYDSTTAAVRNKDVSLLRRPTVKNCIEGGLTTPAPATTASSPVTTPWGTTEPTQAPVTPVTMPAEYWWINGQTRLKKVMVENKSMCLGKNYAGDKECDWNTCNECIAFWEDAMSERSSKRWLQNKIARFCRSGERCYDEVSAARSLQNCEYTATPVSTYIREIETYGYNEVERFLTKEDRTGFMLGWEGCMAEDSHSFAEAFGAKITKETDTHAEFKSNMESVQTKIFAGKLGDLSLRLGRYKLIRYNAPKDKRTGPTRQHLTDHRGSAWNVADDNKQCRYDFLGQLENKRCTVEPMCREHETWGETYCMRDHYYQLFDLEKNFGEKTFCPNKNYNNPNLKLENAVLGQAWARGTTHAQGTKAAEKKTDPWGFTLGVELTPAGVNVNDCCLLNYDEKQKEAVDPCSQIKYKDRWGNERDGGKCRRISTFHFKFNNNPEKSLAKFKEDITSYQELRTRQWGWSDEHFENFDQFKNMDEDDFEFGYGCSSIIESKPGTSRETFVQRDDGTWRQASMADKFCNPPKKTNSEFTVGCKVPDHTGPLGEGWETNHKWDESKDESRVKPKSLKNGEIDPSDFGIWTDFTNCMSAVMKIIEGAAYYPEASETFELSPKTGFHGYANVNKPPASDDGTSEGVESNEKILAGARVGDSKLHMAHIRKLWQQVSPNEDLSNIGFHGGGSRYFDNTKLAEKCIQYLPRGMPAAGDIKPNFDVEMDLIGWYNTENQSGGQNMWLKKTNESDVYEDDREVMKYYKKNDQNKWLFAYDPQYV